MRESTVTKSTLLKAINARLESARWHRKYMEQDASKICYYLDVDPSSADAKDVEQCVYGQITLDEMLLRIRNRKLGQLAGRIAEEGE